MYHTDNSLPKKFINKLSDQYRLNMIKIEMIIKSSTKPFNILNKCRDLIQILLSVNIKTFLNSRSQMNTEKNKAFVRENML